MGKRTKVNRAVSVYKKHQQLVDELINNQPLGIPVMYVVYYYDEVIKDKYDIHPKSVILVIPLSPKDVSRRRYVIGRMRIHS